MALLYGKCKNCGFNSQIKNGYVDGNFYHSFGCLKCKRIFNVLEPDLFSNKKCYVCNSKITDYREELIDETKKKILEKTVPKLTCPKCTKKETVIINQQK